ncbi:MAG: S58 family peptidase [Gammaproteobacteria bacterium]|nr:S58 family peptidase [Gammaproteobacteria bacterium]
MDWLYDQPGMGEHTINPIVGETNDGRVNDMWSDPVRPGHVREALEAAKGGPIAEGSVGAGTGTQAFGWKGGIGTSSRVLPESLGGWTLGVLVQTNYGGFLTINGAPVGRALAQFPYQEALAKAPPVDDREDGSIMIVLATDAPLSALGLERIAKRVMMGLGRTGSYAHNGSGDYIIAFSTAPELRKPRESRNPEGGGVLVNAALSPLFAAAAEATEEAVYNALFMATTVRSARGELKAISIPAVLEVLEAHHALGWNQRYAPGAP